MKKSIVRYYNQEVLDPVINFLEKSNSFQGVSFANNPQAPPFIVIKNTVKNPKKKVLLTGGIHGDEPAGVLGIINNLELIDELCKENSIECTIIPCLNISGYKLNTRNNISNQDINREFHFETSNLEARYFIENFKDSYDLNIDFHETCPEDSSDVAQAGDRLPNEFYLYEVCEDKDKRVGHLIIKTIKELGFKTYQSPTIFGDTNQDGLISYPEACKNPIYAQGTSLDLYLYNNKLSKNALTIETMAHYEMEHRVNQIKEILKICLKKEK